MTDSMSSMQSRREEAEKLISILKESDLSQLNDKEAEFVGTVMLKLKSPLSTFTARQIYWLRDIKDKLIGC